MVLLRIWESHEQACDCGVGLMVSSTSVDNWMGGAHVVHAYLYRREGEPSEAKENNAIEILRKCCADGWGVEYEKDLAAI